jgi:hypothetical protein
MTGRAGRQDIDEGTARLLIKSCPPYRALLGVARLLPVGQIKWRTTQQGVSQWPGHHRQQTSQSNHQPIRLNAINVCGL